jgi:integrase
MRKIIEAERKVVEFLEGIPLMGSTVKTYKSCYRTIRIYCERNDIGVFGFKEAELYIGNLKRRYENGEICRGYYQYLRRSAALLTDQMEGNPLVWEVKKYCQTELNELFDDSLREFGEHLSETQSVGTRRVSMSIARQLLLFLKGGGINDFKAMTGEDVGRFMVDAAPRYGNSMQKLTGTVKKFLLFIDDAGYVKINAGKYLLKPAPAKMKLLPCYTDSEISAILAAVDTSTPLGIRDMAIIKLALGTGLRNVDISAMKLSDIDWRKNEIDIIQSKTNVHIQLPLSPDVGNAIAKYILDARPRIDSPYIFLRNTRPYGRFSDRGSGRGIVNRYWEKAGIAHNAWDGKTFHAFRRTVGTRLVKAEVPLMSVMQILGHKNPDSPKRYISLDDDGLRKCCLDISDYETAKEGLI